MKPTLCLLRQDPAHMGLFRAVVTCLAVGIVMRIAPDLGEDIRSLAGGNLPGGFGPFYLLFTSMVAVFVLSSNAWTRSSRLALGLPLPARRVWAVRTGSLVAVALLSIVALAAVMGLTFESETRRLTMNAVVALAAARSSATVLLLICLFQLPQSGRDRIPIGPPYVVYLIGASLLTLVFSSAQITSMAGTLVLLAIAITLGIYLWWRVPSSFSIGPTIEESETPIWSMPDKRDFELPEPVGDEKLVDSEENPTFALHWILFRALKSNILDWLLLGVLLASAWVATIEFFKGTNAFLPLFFLIIYQFPLLQSALESMTPFDPLPISRRMLWAHSVVPIIGSVAIGIGFALLTIVVSPRPYTQINYSECCVKTPWDYMELSIEGRVPTITASWGESYTPAAHPLWKGRKMALYDPFEVGAESSPRFVEYQMHRAVEAVYGIKVPAASSYSDYDSPIQIANGTKKGAFPFEETRGRLAADRNRTAAAALMLLSLLTTVIMIASLLRFRSSIHRKIFKVPSVGFVIIVVIAIAVSVARFMGLTQVWYIGALISMGIRSFAQLLPLPTSVLWFFCVTFWAGAYLILERVFCTIDFPREKTMNRFAEVY